MDIDSPPSRTPEPNILSRLCICERLEILGVPKENLEQLQPGLVDYVKNNKSQIAEIVSAILPTDDEAVKAVKEDAAESPKASGGSGVEDLFHESMVWLQWLMFDGDPCTALEHLASLNVGQRGVCGAVWGNNDIAYRCRTCEHDPTCAICVPCFQNGNHKDHDYSIIYTGGGCCDCGDVTAWKREGFCSKHRGAEQIQPLPDDYANSLGPVLDSLLSCWGKRLLFGETISMSSPGADNHDVELKNAAEELTSVLVEMLLEFCNSSESLLSFISGKVFSSAGLLEILVRAERFMGDEDVVRKLHELLLKLLGEPRFKYKFAKEFLSYYPTVVNEAIKECTDTVYKKYPLLSTFSVQIFTVPTLTPRLVKEMDLLAMLLECLEEIFVSCSGEDGRLQVAKWERLYETTLRVVEDIRFVMSHSVVPRYVTRDRRDILRTWMKLLSFVQGMNPQKREIGIHVEVENENMHLPFVLGHSIANIHSLLVGGAFSSCDETEEDDLANSCKPDFEEQDSQRHAKVGRLSQESSVSSVTNRGSFDHMSKATENSLFPPSVLWLAFECLRAIENWLGVDDTSGPLLYLLSRNTSPSSGSNLLALRKTLSKFRRGRHVFKLYGGPLPVNNKVTSKHPSRSTVNLDSAQNLDQEITGTSGSNDSIQEGDYTPELEALRVLSLSDWRDIAYTVSVQDISVHIPLHRLLSIILQRALGKCYGESVASSLPIHHDFFGYVLGGCHPHGFSAFVMEHPLRIRVFCAQVHAGMWRKNGDAAILSYEWYRSVRWSEQGLELDLFMLQCCAALAPADLFVKRVLERFELSNYLLLNFEQSSEYESTLVQEMLTLIIQIVKERRFCGLTSSECLQRELLYRLSIGDATRSQLVKSLPRDLSKIDKLQEVLDSIAVYSNPSGTNQGMYKLRKPYWKELDLYHPRWNSRDLQVAEERYMRFCNVSALTTQLPKWSKVYPPLGGIARVATCRTTLQIIRSSLVYALFPNKANASRAPYDVLLNVLHLLSLALDICYVQKGSGDRSCYEGDVIPLLAHAIEEVSISKYGDQSLLSLLVLLMKKYQKENDFMEIGNFNLSSLVESLLKKFAELEHGCMTKLQSLAPEMANQLLQSLPGGDVNGSGSLSDSDKRKAKARERQAAILEKMRAQQSKFLASIGSTEDAGADDSEFVKEECDADVGHASEEDTSITCSLCHNSTSKSPLSYLILLQKSRLLSLVDKGPPLWEQTRRSGKEPMSTVTKTEIVSSPRSNISSSSDVVSSFQLIPLIQDAVNDFASEGQPREVERFMEFIKSHFPSVKNIQLPCTPNIAVEKMETSLFQSFDEYMYSLIQERMHHNISRLEVIWSKRKSPSEQDSVACKGNIKSFVLGKYIAALARETPDNPSGSGNEYTSVSEPRKQVTAYDGFGPSDCDGIYLSSCGHAVHQGCLDRYLQSLKERYTRRIVFEGGHIVDLDQGEFLCPVCRGLANSVLPRLPRDVKMTPSVELSRFILDSNGCLASSNRVATSLLVKEALSLLQSVADIAESCEILRALPMQEYGRSRSNLESVSSVLGGMYYPGSDKILKSDRLSPSLILYDTLKYSLMSTEVASRSRKTSLASNCTLGSLYKELKSSNGLILSLLLSTVNSTRTKNSLDVLIRLRGIQLLAVSICSSIFIGENPSNRCSGNMQEILKLTDIEVQYPDVQFWNRASDPILAHDAFSSLMWIIYCLPCPFLSCEETFLSLVHLFYAITIIQGIATYCKKQQCNLSELDHNDGLVIDVYKVMGDFRATGDCFDSNHIKTSCDITEAIHSLSFPYLRRCALLWKLIHSSTLVPFSEGSCMSDGLSKSTDEMMQSAEDSTEDLLEIGKLEKIFKIPRLDIVLNDEFLRFVVPRWFRCLSEFQDCNKQCVLYSTPAVPFRLMVLPHLYQDLLQRYIKQHCPDCGSVPEEPALCLLCGRLCSPSWRTCCRQNSCQVHALACGAGTGVFLLIRKTTILLQRSARQALWHSPYLDAFGEEDIEMHRGKPLYLNEERYAALTHMVASHGLDRSSKVLRQTSVGAFFML
ncbi:E3 ubiquitin-protein ligase PRT6 [Ipomoea triloba]|uniref:E3 ubiquitin-protein ligase PRT6 n=1 Tax=Ipomoea triloba TaxID=35885 RepID=UPI00125CD693|nr:E3 ubiquitin-protein ligase PRT6 [Ipomoea triloba]